ncbi:hypothetical protein GWK47_020409 [Chionoecetes opilio]|uniref:Uncharacterized protein n=1 Tax=Chionoecetes opilio TaxID=41210 RepID=A0A8J4XTA5_CHIOP|nr:hypothetical protein GWK47_020409 [Chionoecetes opilio]
MLRTILAIQDNLLLHTASHLTSPSLLLLPLTLARLLLALAPPRKLLLPVLPLMLLRQMLIALNLSRIMPLLRTTLADRNTSTNMSPPPWPHCNPRHRSRTPAPRPRNEAPTLSISLDQLRMFGKEVALGTATSVATST